MDVLVTQPPDSPPKSFLFMGWNQLGVTRIEPLPSNVQKIRIAVYGDNVDTYFKEYSISWDGDKYEDIRLK